MTYTFAEQIRYWLPMVSAFLLIVKAYTSGKKNVSEWASRLLDNHLVHIEQATTNTEVETRKTNELIAGQSGKIDMVQATLADQQTKNLEVWQGVLTQLAVIKERMRACGPKTPSRKRK
jgi:hypothetical protein